MTSPTSPTRSCGRKPEVSVGGVRRPHERAEDPQDREEDPEEEQPPMAIAERPQSEPDQKDEPENDIEPTDSPPHDNTSFVEGLNPPAVRIGRRASLLLPRPSTRMALFGPPGEAHLDLAKRAVRIACRAERRRYEQMVDASAAKLPLLR